MYSSRASSRPNSRPTSACTSPTSSVFPQNNNRMTVASIDQNARYRTMVKHLYGKISSNLWFASNPSNPHACHGVLLRKGRGDYCSQPDPVHPALMAAVQALNVEVAFTMSTETIEVIFTAIEPHQTEIMLRNGSQLQILDSLSQVVSSAKGAVKKLQYAALIREERTLLVWHDDLERIMPHAVDIEGKLLALIWGNQNTVQSLMTPTATTYHSYATSPAASNVHLPLEKAGNDPTVEEAEVAEDPEAQASPESVNRPLVLTSSVMVGLGMFLMVVLLFGFGVSTLIYECLQDGSYIRLALLVFIPASLALSVFFFIVVFGNIFQAAGPIGSLQSNTRYFSAIKPNLTRAYNDGFRPPPITIQMPVYKESLEGVIRPTVTSLKAAISYYESRGGSAKIFVNDDGMACITPEEAEQRREFYHDNNIGWVARPKHGDNFIRKGKFKKASNMNFALNLSNKIEDALLQRLDEFMASEKTEYINSYEEDSMYQSALAQVLKENPRAMADGDIRVGEIILIVDSDTRVPEDCLIYGAAEMFLSPEVAIIQHSTGVMQVAWDYFENGITYFTNLVYTSIRFATGSGETAPFVGHNAFLRWQAIQSVSRAEEDGYVAFWSESHVSEDFDMSLRLQVNNNIVRLASYHDNGFKEGVSLTIYDELARWEKYAFGCNELVFNPIYTWLWRGPFTGLFMRFLGSNYPPSSKITVVGYISSYYAIAAAFPLTLANYFLVGWFNGYLDKYYMESWKLFLALIVVFNLFSNISLAVIRSRMGEQSLLGSILENFKWMPMFAIFFGGLSFHLSLAILAHMFSIDMQWGATNKEKENSNFFKEVPKILNSFKWLFLIMFLTIGAMVYLGCYAPRGWEIKGVTAVVPLAITVASHILLPLVLNPSLMIFNY